jgi:hypothetical protein
MKNLLVRQFWLRLYLKLRSYFLRVCYNSLIDWNLIYSCTPHWFEWRSLQVLPCLTCEQLVSFYLICFPFFKCLDMEDCLRQWRSSLLFYHHLYTEINYNQFHRATMSNLKLWIMILLYEAFIKLEGKKIKVMLIYLRELNNKTWPHIQWGWSSIGL